MKKYVFTYLILFIVISCSTTKSKKELLGNWYYSEDGMIDSQFRFYKDSLVMVDGNGWKRKLMWKLDADSIYTLYTDKPGPAYKYKLDEDNQILELLIIPYDSTKVLKFIKAKNGNTFFFNEILGLDIDLPTYKTQLNRPEILKMKIGHNGIYNIYVGYEGNNLVVKTDSSPDLENLKSEVDEFIENLRDELKRHTKFNLIADKSISKYEIDSIKNIMKETSIKQIYRTYKTRHIYDVDTVWVQVKE